MNDMEATNSKKGLKVMASGTVKWFNSAKGYGFICPDNGGQDVFAHFSSIHMEGYKTLKAGQKVAFEVNEGPKGLHANEIRPVSEQGSSQVEKAVYHESLEAEPA